MYHPHIHRITQPSFGLFYLTFHDLLQLHLQGLDRPHWILTRQPVHPVDGELPAPHHGDVVILHVQHLVRVLDDGTVSSDRTYTVCKCLHIL